MYWLFDRSAVNFYKIFCTVRWLFFGNNPSLLYLQKKYTSVVFVSLHSSISMHKTVCLIFTKGGMLDNRQHKKLARTAEGNKKKKTFSKTSIIANFSSRLLDRLKNP